MEFVSVKGKRLRPANRPGRRIFAGASVMGQVDIVARCVETTLPGRAQVNQSPARHPEHLDRSGTSSDATVRTSGSSIGVREVFSRRCACQLSSMRGHSSPPFGLQLTATPISRRAEAIEASARFLPVLDTMSGCDAKVGKSRRARFLSAGRFGDCHIMKHRCF